MLRRRLPLVAAVIATMALAGCDGLIKDTGPDVSPTASVAAIAPPEPAVTDVPASANPLASFDRLDAAHDGRISSPEYAQGAQSLFEMMDMAHDGNLGANELQAGARMLTEIDGLNPATLLRIADSDHDGKLTLSEWMAFNNARFTLLDTSHDDAIDRAEWDAPHPPLPRLP